MEETDEADSAQHAIVRLYDCKKKLIVLTKDVVAKDDGAWAEIISLARDLQQLAARFAQTPVHFDDNEPRIEVVECAPGYSGAYDALSYKSEPVLARQKKRYAKRQNKPQSVSLELENVAEEKTPESPKTTELVAEYPSPLVYQETADLTYFKITQPIAHEYYKKRGKKSARKNLYADYAPSEGEPQPVSYQTEIMLGFGTGEMIEPLKELLDSDSQLMIAQKDQFVPTNHCTCDQEIAAINKLLGSSGYYIIKAVDGIQQWYEIGRTAYYDQAPDARLENAFSDLERYNQRPRTPECNVPVRIAAGSCKKRPVSRTPRGLETEE